MINTKFWVDHYIKDLTPNQKLLFLYFISNPFTNISGIYEMPLEQIELNTKIKVKEIVKTLIKFEKDDKIFYQEGWIIIKNFTKHQSEGEKVQKAIEKELKRLPKRIRDTLSTMPDMVSVLGAYTVLNPTIHKGFKNDSGDNTGDMDLNINSPTYGMRIAKVK